MNNLDDICSLLPKKLCATGIYTAAGFVPPGIPVLLGNGKINFSETISKDEIIELLAEQDARFSPSDISNQGIPTPGDGPQEQKPVLQPSKPIGKGSDPSVRRPEQIGRAGIKKDAEKENEKMVQKLSGELGHEVERKLRQQLGNQSSELDKKKFEKAFGDFTREILSSRPASPTTVPH